VSFFLSKLGFIEIIGMKIKWNMLHHIIRKLVPSRYGGITMASNRLHLEYPIQEKDYINLFTYSPWVRSLKWVILGGMLILVPMFHFLMSLINKTLFSKGQFEIWDSFTILYIFLLYIGACLYGVLKLKSRARKQGKDNYEKLYSGRMLSITYDQNKSEFLVGKQQKRVPVNKDLKVFCMPDNYFFYYGNKKNGVIFLIPKMGDEKHKSNLNTVINELKIKQEIEIREGKIS
jgi:hypothetical protein